jgi:hypothetical protein
MCKSLSSPSPLSEMMFLIIHPSSCWKSTYRNKISIPHSAEFPIESIIVTTTTTLIKVKNKLKKRVKMVTYPTSSKPPHNLPRFFFRRSSLFKHDFARHDAVFVFEHRAALDDGDEFLCEPDLAL